MAQTHRAARAAEAVRAFFDADDPWERPQPTPEERRQDAWIAVAFFAFAALGLEFTRSMGQLNRVEAPVVLQYVGLVAGTVPLAWRRRYPIPVMLILQAHMWVGGVWLASVQTQFAMQVLYFFSLCSGVAWARDRRALVYAVGAVLALMTAWFVWDFAVGSAADGIRENLPHQEERQGLFGPAVAVISYFTMINVVYFAGALLWGRSSWRAARRSAMTQDQAATIEAQAATLRDQAVVDERLRIARELHDVVAHHVSVMGVQAAAARRVLTRDPDAAATALASVEESSRSAVTELRSLLGTLRAADAGAAAGARSSGAADRSPEPGLGQIPALVEKAARPGFFPTYELVSDPPEAAAEVPPPLALSTYRIIQEALSNVRKHSTATHATVVVRVDARVGRYVEAEVVDDGRPVGATSGTGLGLLGMRERIASHGGQLDVGPRLLGGYRVRVRFPLERGGAAVRPEEAADERVST